MMEEGMQIGKWKVRVEPDPELRGMKMTAEMEDEENPLQFIELYCNGGYYARWRNGGDPKKLMEWTNALINPQALKEHIRRHIEREGHKYIFNLSPPLSIEKVSIEVDGSTGIPRLRAIVYFVGEDTETYKYTAEMNRYMKDYEAWIEPAGGKT